jgi:hypothetical protein
MGKQLAMSALPSTAGVLTVADVSALLSFAETSPSGPEVHYHEI